MDIPEDLTHSAYFKMLGCELRRLDEGVAKVALPLEAHLRNRGNVMHGGAIFSLVDIAMGLACSSVHGFDQRSVTIECKINYVRGVSDGEVLCIARVLHAGRRTLVVEAEVVQGDKLVAKAQGTFAVI
ncbi:Phenylacetic acid degradation-related protein [Pseudomonas caricapapayae]|uniref:Phenylacetic acid degradation-related protein n=1 Tax=Pseudomonas caricapapayae TaxID=46678 RepID=A0A0P9LV38_9PSED|nr:PaaI family thioesterase [Pseudomonas caricapapayae]KAA8695057.1 PaaI family thioesterase [Pseudomonas caricapapayae]KPW58533.1 Phenylacetic acid degradation-related protein [Pseudomonas caricapapayae]RMM10602.1 Phenylacetic acid degradation-related protein [Pseudomonas caricapapayae]RMV93713.1 Phenylacetic acid degradation-related protein [Pseudomonas caricapapayae]